MKNIYKVLISVLLISVTVLSTVVTSYASDDVDLESFVDAIILLVKPTIVNEGEDEYIEAVNYLDTVWRAESDAVGAVEVTYQTLSNAVFRLNLNGVPCEIKQLRGAGVTGYVIVGTGSGTILDNYGSYNYKNKYFTGTSGAIFRYAGASPDTLEEDSNDMLHNIFDALLYISSDVRSINSMVYDICFEFLDPDGIVSKLDTLYSEFDEKLRYISNSAQDIASYMSSFNSYLRSISSNTSNLSSIYTKLASINTALTSIDNKISLDGTLNIDASSSNSNVSLSSASLSPVVSAIDNLRVEMARYFSSTEYENFITYEVDMAYYCDSFFFPASCYIPLPAGSYLEYPSVTATCNPSFVYVLPGNSFAHDVQPDGTSILSFNYPTSITLGDAPAEDGCAHFTVDGVPHVVFVPEWYYGATVPLLTDDFDFYAEIFDDNYVSFNFLLDDYTSWDIDYDEVFFAAGGVTLINFRDPFCIDVISPVSDPWLSIYSSVDSMASALYTVDSRLSTIISKLGTGSTGTSGSVDLTTIEATLSTISDKLDNTASNVENTVINITSDNDAYNVFYIEDENGDTQSVTDFAGDLTGASGRLLSLLYRLVFADAMASVDSDLDNLEEFFTSEEPVLETAGMDDNTTYEVVADVWATS